MCSEEVANEPEDEDTPVICKFKESRKDAAGLRKSALQSSMKSMLPVNHLEAGTSHIFSPWNQNTSLSTSADEEPCQRPRPALPRYNSTVSQVSKDNYTFHHYDNVQEYMRDYRRHHTVKCKGPPADTRLYPETTWLPAVKPGPYRRAHTMMPGDGQTVRSLTGMATGDVTDRSTEMLAQTYITLTGDEHHDYDDAALSRILPKLKNGQLGEILRNRCEKLVKADYVPFYQGNTRRINFNVETKAISQRQISEGGETSEVKTGDVSSEVSSGTGVTSRAGQSEDMCEDRHAKKTCPPLPCLTRTRTATRASPLAAVGRKTWVYYMML